MKKRLFTSILSAFMLIVLSVFGLAACQPTETQPTIVLNESVKELTEGDSFTLTATTTPADAEVEWSTSDEAIATVDGGVVLAISEGTATITAQNGTATATCEITVVAAPIPVHNVYFKDGDRTLKTMSVEEGSTVLQYVGATPTRTETEQYTYTFSGWSLTAGGALVDLSTVVIEGETTFHAVFSETLREYEIVWSVNGQTTSTEVAYGETPAYAGETPTKPTEGGVSYTFQGWATTEGGEVLSAIPTVSAVATYYAVFEGKQPAPNFMGGKMQYSANSKEMFLPEGLLDEGVTLNSAVIKTDGSLDSVVYAEGVWAHDAITLTEEELNTNAIGARSVEVSLSNGEEYTVEIEVYAGIIDELSDFPKFFNNEAVVNTNQNNAASYPMIAPSVYGYYIVTKDLGTGAEELSFTQCVDSNFTATCGFNGVLDGQGHTLRFQLTSGGLVGQILGNATIKNLGVIYADETSTQYGVFGYMTNGNPVIENCYIERTNNKYQRWSVFGIMSRPNAKLVLKNTVVYGYNISNECAMNSNMWISASSTNAYLIHARANATGWANVQNFTTVYYDAIENGSRDVPLADIADASGFDDNYWYKENGKLIWKGFETVKVSWVKGDETIEEIATKDGVIMTQGLPADTTTNEGSVSYFWSTSVDGNKVNLGDRFQVKANVTYYMVEKVQTRLYYVKWVIDGEETTEEYEYNEMPVHADPEKAEDDRFTYAFKGWATSANGEVVELGAVVADITYYAVFESTAKVELTTVNEALLYSSADDQLFLPTELTLEMDDTVKITSKDGETTYYENGAWVNNFDLTTEQTNANAIGLFEVMIEKGTDLYAATVKSYAGVIDELEDFKTFFNNDPTTTTPDVYGYYIVTKNLGDGTEVLEFTQSTTTTYKPYNGFSGVLDGQGHTLKFRLKKGGLLGMYLGNATIKNASFIYADETLTTASGAKWKEGDGGYGLFGFMVMGRSVLDNCYFERTNNDYEKASVFGLVARPRGNLVLQNTVIYGFRFNSNASYYPNDITISTSSTNAYVVGGRKDAKIDITTFKMIENFTKVYTNGTGTEADVRGPLATDVTDASGFNECWTKGEYITWKGAQDTAFSSVVKAQ